MPLQSSSLTLYFPMQLQNARAIVSLISRRLVRVGTGLQALGATPASSFCVVWVRGIVNMECQGVLLEGAEGEGGGGVKRTHLSRILFTP